MKVLLLITFLSFSFSASAECRRGIANIFTDESSISKIAAKIDDSSIVEVGKSCVTELGSEAYAETYCECISKSDKTNFDRSRKAFRKKSGQELKGAIFELAQNIANTNDSSLILNCKLNETLKKSCDQQMIDELYPEYIGKDLGVELGRDYFEIFHDSLNENNTINQFRSNMCQSSLGNNSVVGELTQGTLDETCKNFETQVASFCKEEVLSGSEYDTFDFDLASTPNIDDYNYFCKIKDRQPFRKDMKANAIFMMRKAYKSLDEEVNPTCNKICKDNAPYSIHGCHVDQEKALAEFKNAGCIDNVEEPNCKFLKEAIGNQLLKDFKSGEIGEEDLAYFKDHLHKDDFDKIKERIANAKLQTNSMRKGSLVSQFFESKDGEAFDLGRGAKETNVAKTTPKTAPQKMPSQKQEVSSQKPAMQQTAPPQNMAAAEQGQGPQDSVGPIQGQASSGSLRMGARGRGSRKVSQKTKQIAQTIKTLREAGSSLADALAQQEKRLKKERQKIAQENRDKYQRYDAETLQPIVRGPSDSNSRSNRHSPLANVASASGSSGAMPSGGGSSGGTGSSTFLPPEKKATVVDVTGRSAPNLDLNSLKSSGATLPSSITNHPDASEISKMFNGLEYQKGQGEGRGPASAKSNIKKIKVDWGASSIDLGSLLINAKDLKPGEEFIVYKGDMDKYVKLVPAYRFRAGKRVFIGYRIENRSSENADLAASIFAKKFLIL